ncbi:hypothetical protein [Nocardia sp. NPDC051832]|uniref:hypothetical protein n=1 Tax=Nocardia sp. NPDC051832 TaxID=3155673 RepID=UPI00343E3711
MNLSVELAEWTDWDGAAYIVGRALGVFSAEEGFLDVKGVFWSANPLGEGLHRALGALADAGVLERRDEPDTQFRWSKSQPNDPVRLAF